MSPKEVVKNWIERFNESDPEGIAELYSEDAINDQVVFDEPLEGRETIKEMFKLEFSRAEMLCIEEKIHECGDFAILQWRDPNGLRGCGFFRVKNGWIVHQTGYFDQLSFFRAHKLPIPKNYLES